MATSIQKRVADGGEKKTMQQYIKSMEGEIKKALPSVITPERFTRMVLCGLHAEVFPRSDDERGAARA